jgi:chromatin assembly factor 1 subunit B
MKIETPQILWHNGSEGNGKPAPLYSVSILPKSINKADTTETNTTTNSSTSTNTSTNEDEPEILATAGNSNEIHIWKIKLTAVHTQNQTQEPTPKKPKIFSLASPTIQHITTLTRHERSINSVQFSPNGNHLASAGDGGTLIVHTVPHSHSTPKKNEIFWNKLLQSEKDLSIKIVHTGSEDVMDISWSNCSDKFMIGTLDHSVLVFQQDFCHQELIVKKWNCIWKNNKEHTHYVQGVAFDPLGVYLASQGSDRSVRVWQRKGNGKGGQSSLNACKKKVLMDQDKNKGVGTDGNDVVTTEQVIDVARVGNVADSGVGVLVEHVERHLSGKFDVNKAKVLKYRMSNSQEDEHANAKDSSTSVPASDSGAGSALAVKKRYLYADESTVESFFRRLAWTTDGAFLITPASLWHKMTQGTEHEPAAASASDGDNDGPSFATYLFARHQFDKPFKVLHGLEKPSLVIRPNPILFQLPNQVQIDIKENLQSSPSSVASNEMSMRRGELNLPYRSIFAVLTVDSILIYDTLHSSPLCIAKNLHYAGLTDCSWSSDGHHLIVCSTDGYISMISFEDGELGHVYVDESDATNANVNAMDGVAAGHGSGGDDCKVSNTPVKSKPKSIGSKVEVTIPPCEPGESVIIAPPSKKARTTDVESEKIVKTNTLQVRKKKRVAPMLMTMHSGGVAEEEQSCNETDVIVEKAVVEEGVTNLSIHNSSMEQSTN